MLFLAPADLRAMDARGLAEMLIRTDLTLAYGQGELGGCAAAALLFADYAVVSTGATLLVDGAEVWAGIAWRLAGRTVGWHVRGGALAEVVDEVTDTAPQQWLEEWILHRSVPALDAGAMLLRSRGGDRLERAEFARLFAMGEPQTGLGAFLAKERPSYSRNPEKP